MFLLPGNNIFGRRIKNRGLAKNFLFTLLFFNPLRPTLSCYNPLQATVDLYLSIDLKDYLERSKTTHTHTHTHERIMC